MKIYMMTDLEGVAGVTTFYKDTTPEGPYYAQARKLLTAEINAVIEGLLSEGVEEVLVGDWHGPGAVNFAELHPRALLLHGRPMAPFSALNEATRHYDALVIVGQHAMAGTVDGNMNHTQSSMSIDSYKLNGRPIGEIAQAALYQGSFGQPLIFLSGDEAACREAEALVPGIVTTAVKKGVARNCAISCSAQEAARRLREGAAEAVRRHRQTPVAPLRWDPPYVLEKKYFHTDSADQAATHPLAERVDSQTVRLRSNELRAIIYA
jgi:D-amino peptidase